MVSMVSRVHSSWCETKTHSGGTRALAADVLSLNRMRYMQHFWPCTHGGSSDPFFFNFRLVTRLARHISAVNNSCKVCGTICVSSRVFLFAPVSSGAARFLLMTMEKKNGFFLAFSSETKNYSVHHICEIIARHRATVHTTNMVLNVDKKLGYSKLVTLMGCIHLAPESIMAMVCGE